MHIRVVRKLVFGTSTTGLSKLRAVLYLCAAVVLLTHVCRTLNRLQMSVIVIGFI